MTAKINVGGVYKDMTDCKVNISGVWKPVDTIFNNIGGVWKTAYTSFPGVYLYKEGEDYTNYNYLTGGWSANRGSPVITFNATNMVLGPKQAITINAATVNLIDLTDYDIFYGELSTTASAANCVLQVKDDVSVAASVAITALTTQARELISVDISAITGLHYIAFAVFDGTATLYNMWLE